MINKVILLGNVGKDPNVRMLKEDMKKADFTLATSEYYMKDGQKIEQTEWHNIACWRKNADFVEKYVKKGSQLYIEGKITTRSYEKDGQTKYITEIVANEVRILGRKPESGTTSEGVANTSKMAVSEPNGQYASISDEDDLPF